MKHTHDSGHRGIKVPIGSPLKKIFDVAYACGSPLLLFGETGTGKSEFVAWYAASLGLEAIVINLALLEGPGELIGLSRIEDGRTTYAVPSFLPTEEGRGVIIFEEPNRAPAYLLAAIYELMTSRKLGEYTLPDGYWIVACANPPTSDYHVGAFDKAMLDRFLRIDVCVDREQWALWAEGHGIHPALVSIARDDGRLFDVESPRTWAKGSAYIQAARRVGASQETLELLLSSLFSSTEVARSVVRCLGTDTPREDPINPLNVLVNYCWDDELGEAVRQLADDGQTDALEKLVDDVGQIVGGYQLAGLVGMGGFELDSFELFLDDVPGDRAVDLKRALSENPESAALLDIEPSEALVRYKKSALSQKVAAWKDRALAHRLAAVMHAVARHLDRLDRAGKMDELRANQFLEPNLARFIADVGVDHARPLLAQMDRLGLVYNLSESV